MTDATPFDLVLTGDIVLADRVIPGGYVAVRGETVAAIGAGAPPPAKRIADFAGKVIMPGLVDGHMHTSSSAGWPGIENATLSAAAGGVTTVCDMPYDVPNPVTTAALFADKVAHVGRLAHVDMALYGTIKKSGGLEDIAALAEAGASAFKVSTYEYDAHRFPRIDHPTMLAAFAEMAKTGLMVAVHNEDQELVVKLTDAAKEAGNTSPIWHCRTRPPLAESMADLEIFEMALETGAHVHIAHSSIARGFELAGIYRGQGAKTSGEACIQYLCMTEDDIVRLQGFGKCNPPFRTAAEVERMWQAIAAGIVSYVSTDHAPWPKARKEYHGDIFALGAGLTGLQSFAPLMYTLLVERGLSPTIMARLCSEQPARYHGLDPKKGGIRIGADADFCILEPGDFVFDDRIIQDREEFRWSAYHGRPMKARVASTWLRGTELWDGTEVKAKPGSGRFVPRQHKRSALDA
ncbi:dihydroorotase family protein [Roseomonas sp. AR75]|uniref:dihydroorotase n=1 Tax=Roseomonas sp. AR75 TaxID=2562311 RepID=UPI0010C0740E|nr:amidohydrolase family protein [Roseomonas sp. AR75]